MSSSSNSPTNNKPKPPAPSPPAAATAALSDASGSGKKSKNNSPVVVSTTTAAATTTATTSDTSTTGSNNRPSPPESKRQRTATATTTLTPTATSSSLFFDSAATTRSAAAAAAAAKSNNNKTTTTGGGNISNCPMLPDAAAASLLDTTASASNLSLLHQVTHLSWVFTRNNDCGQWHAEGTTSLYIIDNSAATARVAAAAAAKGNNINSSDKSSSSSPQAQQQQQQQQQQAAARAAAAAAVAANEASTTTLALHLKGSCQVLHVQVEALNKRAVLTPLSSNTTFLHADPLQHVLIKSPSSYCIQDFMLDVNINSSNDKDDDDDNNNNMNHNRRPYCFDADAQSSRGAMGMTKGLRAASIASLKGELLISCPRAEVLVGANVVNVKTTTTTTASTSDGASSTTRTTTTSPAQEAAMKAWQKALTASSSSSSSSLSSSTANSTTSPRKSSLSNNATTTPSSSPTSNAAAAALGDDDSASLFGIGMLELQNRLYNRSQARRPKRIQMISRRLAAASASPIRNTAFRVTIHWRILLPKSNNNNTTISRHHLGGLHVLTGMDDDLPAFGGRGRGDSRVAAANQSSTTTTPHVYTTAGVLGDHQGPRSWLPCLDAGSTNFRASHELYVKLTAPVREGLSICGMGEDVGVWESYLHENINSSTSASGPSSPPTSLLVHQEQQQPLIGNNKTMLTTATTNVLEETSRILGADHVAHVQRIQCNSNIESLGTTTASSGMNQQQQEQQQNQQQPHVIPPDQNNLPTTTTTLSLNDIQATCLWCSASWTPIPARSLGLAMGPFKSLEDPEYFGPTGPVGAAAAVQADDEDGDAMERRLLEFCQTARQNGEGIRQVYFAPLMERKYLHLTGNSIFTNTNRRLLPNTRILLQPLSVHQQKTIHDLNQTVTFTTVGVAHRALSLMRDVLALPRYRTNSYTQIWIPHAVDGGTTSGALRSCPECLVNPFLGGAILDARLLPPIASRLPYYQGGRVLQFLQARNAIRGWILAALPLGGNDDVGNGYIHTLVESFIMSLYERGHGAHGEGGARGGVFFSRRYSPTSGLNSSNLDFLPVRNIEEMSSVAGGLGAVPVEDRHNDQLWRSATNGSESHTSAMDEYSTRQLLCKDVLEALERGNDRDKQVPTPSMGWHGAGFLFGSHLSLTFLSSNASSSSDLGCGAFELFHPIGSLVYRTLKTEIFRGVVEGRAGVANLLRLMRASFVAAHLGDQGEAELVLPVRRNRKPAKDDEHPDKQEDVLPKPPFVVCVNEILAKKGLTHTLFTRALQNICGKLREGLLLGTLVDVERNAEDPRTRRPFVEPEGFPNSYVRGASLLYCRVGVQVEQSREANSVGKVQAQIYAEPIIPEGGIAFGGPVTVRVVENEGQFREYMKDLSVDGSRRDWGAMVLHAKPVTTPKAQAAASGTVESSESTKTAKSPSKQGAIGGHGGGGVFADSHFHSAGFQAIELIRITNLTPLLWVRVDPAGLYGGRISVVQPDACLAEQLFHDGDAAAQVDALRQLAERPLRIQGSVKVTSVYDVAISDLPVRVLGDCLRGSPALHSSLPHTPAVRRLAALAIAQWQNNKAPQSKDAVGTDSWLGIDLLIQYFRERFYSSSVVMPMKFTRLAVRKSEAEARAASAANEGGAGNPKPSHDDSFQYLDALDEGDERAAALEDASDVETEEDEEYRVRAAAVTAVASIRAKDGQTPSAAIQFLEAVLEAEDDNMMGNVVFPDDDMMLEKTFRKLKSGGDEKENADSDDNSVDDELPTPSLSYIASQLVADTLLALCHVNASPTVYTDPSSGKSIHATGRHPVTKLMELSKGWLDWEMYRETIRAEVNLATRTGIAGNCHDVIAACAIVSLSSLAILRQITTHSIPEDNKSKSSDPLHELTTAKYYMDIFDSKPQRNDHTRAAAAQAVACICCAADRFEVESIPALGLLTALEFLLDRIIEEQTSPSLRQTLAMIMMDTCTGKVCSMQRVGSIAGRNDLITSAARFFCGPLLASHGGDCGGALLMSVTPASFPAASSVNDGARRGMRVLNRAGHPRDTNMSRPLVVRVARFATRLWRTINGEPADALTVPIGISKDASPTVVTGVCSYDGALRCSLLSLWLILWPKGCFAVLQVQAWKTREGTTEYKEMGAQHVMKITDSEMKAAKEEDASLNDLASLVNSEIDRQAWRGEMAQKAYSLFKSQGNNSTTVVDAAAAEQGIGQPLPPIQRDMAFKQGGWIASAAQQRRAKALDGGTAVTKLRLKVGGSK